MPTSPATPTSSAVRALDAALAEEEANMTARAAASAANSAATNKKLKKTKMLTAPFRRARRIRGVKALISEHAAFAAKQKSQPKESKGPGTGDGTDKKEATKRTKSKSQSKKSSKSRMRRSKSASNLLERPRPEPESKPEAMPLSLTTKPIPGGKILEDLASSMRCRSDYAESPVGYMGRFNPMSFDGDTDDEDDGNDYPEETFQKAILSDQ